MGNFEISKGKKFDLTNVSDTEISINEIAKNKKKLIDIFNKFDLDKNGKLNTIELAKAMDYFSSFDTDTEGEDFGNISNEEMTNGLLRLNTELKLDGKDAITEKDIKSFIVNTNKASINQNQLDLSEFSNFGYNPELFDLQNVIKSEVIESENGKKYVLTYNDGKIVTINPDKSYEVKTVSSNNTITTEYYDKDNIKTQSVINYPDTGDTSTTTYIVSPTQGVIPSNTICTYNNGAKTAEIKYMDGVPTQEIIKEGSSLKIYSYVGSEIVPFQFIENQGTPNEKITNFERNENGTYTITTRESGKISVKIAISYLPNSSTVSETIYEETEEGTTKTEKVRLEDGYAERITLPNNNVVITIYNSDNQKLFKSMTEGNTYYYAEYDGNGNTKGVYVKFNETPQDIARLTNCEVSDILELNRSKVIKAGNNYGFRVGEEIMIPTELDPQNNILYRNPELETRRYESWQEEDRRQQEIARAERTQRAGSMKRTLVVKNFGKYEDLAIDLYKQEGVNNPSKYQISERVQELKELNPEISDGALMNKTLKVKYSPRKDLEISNRLVRMHRKSPEKIIARDQGETIAEHLHNSIFHNNNEEFIQYFNQITPDNIAEVLTAYSEKSPDETLIEAIWDEKRIDETTRKNYQRKLAEMLIQRAQKSGLDSATIDNFRNKISVFIDAQSDALDIPLRILSGQPVVDETKNILRQIQLVENISEEEITRTEFESHKPEEDFLAAMTTQSTTASQILEHQDDIDGWAAAFWHFNKYIHTFGQYRNCRGKVNESIDEFNNMKAELNKAYREGGSAAFKAKLREYGINYDDRLTRSYSAKLRNLAQAKALQSLYDTVMEELPKGTSITSYTELTNAYTKFLMQTNPNMSQEEAKNRLEGLIKAEMEAKGLEYTSEYSSNKFIILRNMTDKLLQTLEQQRDLYTDNKSITQMEQELISDGASLFGTDKDIIRKANDYATDQIIGDAIITTSTKIAAMVTIGAFTGGGSAAMIGTFGTSMAIDVSNDLSRNTPYTRQKFNTTFAYSTLDALFAGTSTYARDQLKLFSIYKKAGKIGQFGLKTSSDFSVATGKDSLTGNLNGENILYSLAFLSLAHGITAKEIKIGRLSSSNSSRVTRRTISGVNKERKAMGSDTPTEQQNQLQNLSIPEENVHESLLAAISNINNSGDLNALKRNLVAMGDAITEQNRNEILLAINTRQQELFENPDLASVQTSLIDTQTQNTAIAALSSTNKHLLPDEIYAISLYINSVTDTNELLNIYNKLKTKDVNLLAYDSDIFCILDDRFSELNIKKPYKEMA